MHIPNLVTRHQTHATISVTLTDPNATHVRVSVAWWVIWGSAGTSGCTTAEYLTALPHISEA